MLPRLENAATSLSLSVNPANASLVNPRGLSIAPTLMTFFAVAGARTESGRPAVPLVVPDPLLPAANT